MKKVIIGLLSLFVIIMFSAFTTTSGNQKPAKVNGLYWYPATGNTIDYLHPVGGGAQMTREQVIEDDLVPCDPGESEDCIRGFATQQFSAETNQPDDVFLKD